MQDDKLNENTIEEIEAESDLKSKFVIGEFTFQTFHEYRDGQEDVKKIETINRELDIHDPEVAVRLYNMIRDGRIVFKSPIGEQFFSHIADIVADQSVDLLEDKAVVEEAEGKVKHQKVLGIAIISLAVVAFVYFAAMEIGNIMTAQKIKSLQKETKTKTTAESNTAEESSTKSSTEDTENSIDTSKLTILPEYVQLHTQNPEMVGWLQIDDTDVNYPVMQKNNDNEYYLKHAFDHTEDTNGTLFVDYRSNIVSPTTNTIIYGHNMKSGLMFGGLKKYLDKNYYDAHKTVHFNTLYEKRTYEIVAVCLSQVDYKDQNGFRYYNFITSKSDSDFQQFYETIQGLSAFGSDVDLHTTDQILTLSTCNSYTEDGRLFLVAKRIN